MKIKKTDYEKLKKHYIANHNWNGPTLQIDYISEYSTMKAIKAINPNIKLKDAFNLIEKIKAEV